MRFREGEAVVHSTYGLGKIIGEEERTLYGRTLMYYAVRIDDMTVWVPADENLETRLRPPIRQEEFERLFEILTGPGEPLPDDRQSRKEILRERLRDGRAESLCYVIRSLEDFRRTHSLNENDQLHLKRAQHTLAAEWGYSMSITPEQAGDELLHLLSESDGAKRGKS
ncbi:MAG: CarD family transcriptional regulator [Chloroflexota bacterium]